MSSYSFDTENVTIAKHREIEREGKLLILGEVENSGDNHAKGVSVIVDLYLNNEFVKQCDGRVKGGIPSGESRNFEISCGGGCKNKPIVEHDPYKVYLTSFF